MYNLLIKKISNGCDKPESKFVMDMIYRISKSKDILLSSIADALDEKAKKAYTIDRLYLQKKMTPVLYKKSSFF